MKRSLLKTASVLALSLFAFPVLAQSYAPVNNDPYGYGNVPLPPPQPMMMPSYQAQQAAGNFMPLNRYASQYANQASLYAGQSTPQPVTTAQYGVVPNYLPASRTQNNQADIPSPQASSVGYVVQPQAAAPQAAAQYGSQYGAQAGQAVQGAAQPYAPQSAQAYGAIQQAPVAYGAANQAANQYATTAANSYAAPQVNVTAPQVNVQPPSYGASAYSAPSYSPGNVAVQNSITTAPSYDGAASASSFQPLSSYQNASSQQAYAPQAYAPQANVQLANAQPANAQPAQPYVGQTYVTQPDASQAQPIQQQAYAYGSQPQTYTTTQIYTPSPALTVQQTADANSQVYGQQAYSQNTAPIVEDNVSLATDPSVGPWYFSLRSGLTLAQDTALAVKGATVENEYQSGWQLGTGVGYEFKAWNNWVAPRAELELTYDQQQVDAHSINGKKTSDPDAYGFQRNLDLMANGFLDFRLNRYLAPYVGGGVGVGFADFDRYGTSATGVVIDENDFGFVWQAMGGLGINLSSSSTVDLGYRYQQNTGVTIKARDGTSVTTDEGKHVLMIGFRNNF